MTEPLTAEEVEQAREYRARWGPANMMFGEDRYLVTIDALTARAEAAEQNAVKFRDQVEAEYGHYLTERARAEAAEMMAKTNEMLWRSADRDVVWAADLLEAAEAERDRYKGALEEIARLVPITGVSPEGIARRALAPTTEEKP